MTPLYAEEISDDKLKRHGRHVFENIGKAVILKTVHRQADDRFKRLLDNISRVKATDEDYMLLETRFYTNVSAEERKLFNKALNIFPGKKKVSKENMIYLSKLRFESSNLPVPIVEIIADHNNPEAVEGTVDQAGGLSSVLYLGPSCQIMLRWNAWTEVGLVNGAVGTIEDIVYLENEKPPESRPAFLICVFDGYKGPYLGNDVNKKLVPIPMVSRSWTLKCGTQCTRTTFPVQIAHATTVHKSQGLTLEKVCNIMMLFDVVELSFFKGVLNIMFEN